MTGPLPNKFSIFAVGVRSRKIVAVKGVSGTRPAWEESKGKKSRGRLFLVGVDMIKNRLHHLIKTGRIEFSDRSPGSFLRGTDGRNSRCASIPWATDPPMGSGYFESKGGSSRLHRLRDGRAVADYYFGRSAPW